jgi:hypothetical protein
VWKRSHSASAIPIESQVSHHSRRAFLKSATAVAAGVMATPKSLRAEAEPLPTIDLGGKKITRLIAGGNTLYGYSHFNMILDQHYLDYFTDERVVQFLLDCEKAGINTWQSNYRDRAQRQYPKIRDAGCKMHWICLADPTDALKGGWAAIKTPEDANSALMKVVSLAAKAKPVAMAHHGNVTDNLYRAGKLELVREFLNKVHDMGFPAGVSSHNPEVIATVEEKGWPADFYMGCFYCQSRTDDDYHRELGCVPLGESYLPADPPKMCAVLRKTSKPSLGFKILAAGRLCTSPKKVREAFEFAFKNLKPTDGVIVGMYPRFTDQIAENARIVRDVAA